MTEMQLFIDISNDGLRSTYVPSSASTPVLCIACVCIYMYRRSSIIGMTRSKKRFLDKRNPNKWGSSIPRIEIRIVIVVVYMECFINIGNASNMVIKVPKIKDPLYIYFYDLLVFTWFAKYYLCKKCIHKYTVLQLHPKNGNEFMTQAAA